MKPAAIEASVDALIHAAEESFPARLEELLALIRGRNADESRGRLLQFTDHFEHRALEVTRRAVALRRGQVGHLNRLLVVVDRVRDEALFAVREPRPDRLHELDRDLDVLTRQRSYELQTPADHEELRRRVDDALTERLLEASGREPDPITPAKTLAAIGDHLAEVRSRGRTDLLPNLIRARARVWKQIHKHLRALSDEPERQAQFMRRLMDEVEDRAEDILARATAQSDKSAGDSLRNLSQNISRLLWLHRVFKSEHPERRLRRTLRRIRDSELDRRVRRGQLRLLGIPWLRRLELLIVVLVILVIAILGVDLFGSLDDAERRRLAFIDGGICSVLLLEFAWRFRLSGYSLRYFWRYFWFDVLPSIPFALILELHLQSLGNVRPEVVQAFRTSRLFRLLRGIRMLRILGFAIAGLDRLVRRQSDFLNRNIVVFDPPSEREEGVQRLAIRLKKLRERIFRALTRATLELPPSDRAQIYTDRVAGLKERIQSLPVSLQAQPLPVRNHQRDVRVEEFIEEFLSIDRTTVEMAFSEERARRLAQLLRLFDLPLVRRLPLLRDTVTGARQLDPFEAIARAARGLGRFADRIIERLRFVGDLTGIVTSSQLLDRIGSTLVKATQRPATRLLLFGMASMLVSWLMGTPEPGSWLYSIDDFFKRVLGKTFLILGAVCLCIQAFGRWIKKLAGDATDLFEKVAEAQGINLLKFHKLRHREEDLQFLFERTLLPELRLLNSSPEECDQERQSFVSISPMSGSMEMRRGSPLASAGEAVLFLFMDYLDGAILHKSNVKSTEQFLGNLEIESIRHQRLSLGAKERRRLKRLDLQGARAMPTGPYLWFRFITESLAQRAAKLVIHYNTLAIPLKELPRARTEDLVAMNAWLGNREDSSDINPAVGYMVGSAQFHALHFMSADPERDDWVEEVYGASVRARLQKDRRQMIRSVFSTYPYEWLPRHRRTVNPFALYFDWVGRGRILILPFRIVFTWARVWFGAFRTLIHIIRDQLRPTGLRKMNMERISDEDVAMRKIHRMHLPVFMAVLDLRARFDPEYLQNDEETPALMHQGGASVMGDLDFIGAREFQREHYFTLKQECEESRAEFESLLADLGFPGGPLLAALGLQPADLEGTNQSEALRALRVAFHINYRECRSLLLSDQRVNRTSEALMADPKDAPTPSFLWWWPHHREFEQWFRESAFANRTPKEKAILRGAFARNRGRLRNRIRTLRNAGGAQGARAEGLRILREVATSPAPWSRQILTLRTIQALTCLDIANSRRVVLELADYDGRAEGAPKEP